MTISINNVNNPQVNNLGQNKQTAAVSKEAGTTAQKNVSTQSTDTIALTDSAKLILQLEKQLSSFPVVDAEKVSQVKENLNSGNYTISSERVAQKFTQYESLLQAAS